MSDLLVLVLVDADAQPGRHLVPPARLLEPDLPRRPRARRLLQDGLHPGDRLGLCALPDRGGRIR